MKLFTAEDKSRDYPSYVDLSRAYRRGDRRIVFDMLKAKDRLDALELTLRIMRAKGLDDADTVLRNGVSFRVIHVLKRHGLRGVLVKRGREMAFA